MHVKLRTENRWWDVEDDTMEIEIAKDYEFGPFGAFHVDPVLPGYVFRNLRIREHILANKCRKDTPNAQTFSEHNFVPAPGCNCHKEQSCAVSVDPLDREIRSAGGDAPGVSFSGSGY